MSTGRQGLMLPSPCRPLVHRAAAVGTTDAASPRRRRRSLCVALGPMRVVADAAEARRRAGAHAPTGAPGGDAGAGKRGGGGAGRAASTVRGAADVAEFRNANGNAHGSLDVRRGMPGSSVDFTLEAWFHRHLPGGGAIGISCLVFCLNGAPDAPHFLMELIHGGPASLVVILDLLSCKDLPLHPDYITRYYEATGVDAHRRSLERLPQVRPYISPLLLVRSLWSPTAVVVDVQCGEGGEAAIEEIVRGQVATSAKEFLGVGLEHCATAVEMSEEERESMVARDKMISTTELELNLSANLPRMFDADISARVVAEIRRAFVGH